jgi:acetyl esterase/lipase
MIRYDDLIAAPMPRAARRVRYGPDSLQFGDLWLPADAAGAKRATVVFIHGGCWESAYSLDHASYLSSALANAGYVVWMPEYRRLGDAGAGWPGTFEDVAMAVDYVRELARTEPSVDTTRVILAGHSAGGQLALWAAARRAGKAGATTPLPVVGVVALAAITDLAACASASGSCNESVAPLLGGGPDAVPDRYRLASPIERLPIGVPMHLVHGEADPIVAIGQSESFVARARALGDDATVTKITNAGHFDVIAPRTPAWAAVVAAFEGIRPPRRG